MGQHRRRHCRAAQRGTRRRAAAIIPVGTTSLRLLESAVRATTARIAAFEGDTAIFITPGYRFRATDGLDHQLPSAPKSTLFMLVSAR